MKKLFTSESVTLGHPDKICDRISDSVLDAILAQDPNARVACESFCTTGFITVMGEISTTANIDIQKIARRAINETGYNSAEAGFDGNTCAVITTVHEQSPDIALGVDNSMEKKGGNSADKDDHGAGDQGMMFGFACNETDSYMPMPIYYAHKLAKKLEEVRTSGELDYLRPDGKTQVTVEYDGDKPVRIDTVVVSTQHKPTVSTEQLRADITEKVIAKILPSELLDENTKYFVNPTGRFEVGGPQGDCGLTGRKIIVDTYGGYSRHGGGAFSGKDPTKVDRSAAYAARYVAKNVVAAGIADKCEIQLAYAIGVAKPVSIMVETFGTGKYDDGVIADAVAKVFDLRPSAIIESLDLRRPIYTKLSSYGHVGRDDLDLPWEKLDKTEALKAAING